jgi:NTP pyrophosphatase (non-canonical NTP hydrolase)
MTLEHVEQRLRDWHLTRYKSVDPDMVRIALKACEEVGEIAKAVLKGDHQNLREEVADVFFLLIHLSRGLGTDLLTLASEKLPVIEERLRKGKCK